MEENFRVVNFPGEVLHWSDLTEVLYKILVNCFTSSLPTQFCMWRFFGGIIPGAIFRVFGVPGKNSHGRGGIFRVIGNRLEMKVFFKVKYAKENFSGCIVHKTNY